jgi:hypothetical protein
MSPLRAIALGFVLVLLGFLIPLLMTLRIIEADLALSFLGYGASVAGLLLGMIGASGHIRKGKR